MFVVTEAQAAVIRTVYEQRGEFSAAVELRQLFPGINNVQARECVRTIAALPYLTDEGAYHGGCGRRDAQRAD